MRNFIGWAKIFRRCNTDILTRAEYFSSEGYLLNVEGLDKDLYLKTHTISDVEDIHHLINIEPVLADAQSSKLPVEKLSETFIFHRDCFELYGKRVYELFSSETRKVFAAVMEYL